MHVNNEYYELIKSLNDPTSLKPNNYNYFKIIVLLYLIFTIIYNTFILNE